MDFLTISSGNTGLYHSQGGATVLALGRGVVGNAFRLKRSYSAPGPVSTAMGDCLRAGTAIGFRASRNISSNFLFCILAHAYRSHQKTDHDRLWLKTRVFA